MPAWSALPSRERRREPRLRLCGGARPEPRRLWRAIMRLRSSSTEELIVKLLSRFLVAPVATLIFLFLGPAAAATRAAPPVAPVRPVTTDYFGTAVTDNYRYMENLQDPQVQAWMKAQND